MKSVVVEDDPVMRGLLQTRLRSRGHEVLAFESATDALSLLEQEPIPLVVLDWLLPGELDGLDLCRRLRSLPHGLYSYVLVITARTERSSLDEVLAAGADDYLPKPVTHEVLEVRLTVAERGARARRSQLRAEAARRDAENRLASVLWNSPLAAWIADTEGTILSEEGRLVPALSGGTPTPGRSLTDLASGRLIQPDDVRRAARGEAVTRTVGLAGLDVELRLASLPAEVPQEENRLGLVVHDLSETMARVRRSEDFALETRAQLERYQQALAGLSGSFVVVDDEGRIEYLAPSCWDLPGVRVEQPLQLRWPDALALPPAAKAELERALGIPARDRTPVRVFQERADATQRALRMEWLSLPHHDRTLLLCRDITLEEHLRARTDAGRRAEGVVALSAPMQRFVRLLDGVAPSDAPLLIECEPGDAPIVWARLVHRRSRRSGAWHEVACSAMGETALRNALFGPGGAVERSHGGTLFLDDIDQLPRAIQLELLWMLEEGQFRRPGGGERVRATCRVVAGSTVPVAPLVAAGAYSGELFQRLRETRLNVPPLRQRRLDLPALIDQLLVRARASTGNPQLQLDREAAHALCEWSWPGNTAELETTIDSLTRVAHSGLITADELPERLRRDAKPTAGVDERSRILDALRQTHGNRKLAAQLLGVSRATFYRRIQALGLRFDGTRGVAPTRKRRAAK